MTTKTLSASPEKLLDFLGRQGSWTDREYLALTDHTTRLVEFTDGFLEVLPMPTDKHQKILKLLLLTFDAFLNTVGGEVLFSPLRLRIRKGKFREPDLLMVLSASDPRRQNRFWTGADLVVEVVSPDKPERDLVDKRLDYAEGGVPEYWIVNPLDETILVLVLNKKKYREFGHFARGDMARSSTLEGFAISVDQVFDVN